MNDHRSLSPDSEALTERLRVLKETLPECFTEGRLDPVKLRETLGDENLDEGPERYGLTWPGKRESRTRAFKPSNMALHFALGEGLNEETTKNLVIEGENLEVLRLLQKAYRGRVKMIYIDPPYNTGNDFVYDDKFAESPLEYEKRTGLRAEDGTALQSNRKSSGRFHSNWLSMMYPRLMLAKDFLRGDGFIVISIDDAELKNLLEMADEIYGEENRLATLVIDKNRKNDARFFSIGHEYMVVFSRNKQYLIDKDIRLRATKEGVEELKKVFETARIQYRNDWKEVLEAIKKYFSALPVDDPRQQLARFNKVDERGPYRTDGDPSWPGGNGPRYEVLHPITKEACKMPSRGWVWPTYERMKEEIEKGHIVFGEDESTIPMVRRNLFEKSDQVMRSVSFSYAQTINQEFSALFDGKAIFENPKGVNDIKKVVTYLADEDSVVFDFFAGSGTTAQAVLELNEEDGGNRQFILVQMPEETPKDSEARKAGYKTIAEIAKERVRRVIKKINKEKGKLTDRDRGFRVLKLAKTGFKEWRDFAGGSLEEYEKQLSLHLAETDDKVKDEDLVAEIMLKEGFPLDSRIEKIEEGALAVTRVESEASPHRLFVCLDAGFGRSLTVRTFEKLAVTPEDVFVCRDNALTDEAKLRIRELCRLATV
jgi:adenine-specific DNA-methyltransferase